MTQATPRVSVLLTTYNHAPWIRESAESVLAQRGVSGVEIWIGDDGSTDGTREIVEALAAEHAGRLQTILRERNVGDRGVAMFREMWTRSSGEFIALLDGDDRWTAGDKLARQVAQLDAHPECALSFHDVVVVDATGAPYSQPYVPSTVRGPLSLEDLLVDNVIPACSPLLRRSALSALPEWYGELEFGDWPLYLLAMEHGVAGYIPERLGVYRSHGKGAWSRMTRAEQRQATVRFLNSMRPHLSVRYHAALERGIARATTSAD